MKNISFIGSGNVATHLAKALKNAGFQINEIYSSHIENSQELAQKVGAMAIKKLADLDVVNLDLLIISVNDDAIKNVAELIPNSNAILVHTSGTKDIAELGSHKNIGVFYPLQTFSKEREIEFDSVPVCIEANSERVQNQIHKIARTISSDVRLTNSLKRADIHVAAVIACNFSNHLLALSQMVLEESGEDLSILKPLMQETISKAFSNSPSEVQTGPAQRGDVEVIKKHLKRLEANPDLQKLYQDLSNSIIKLKNE